MYINLLHTDTSGNTRCSLVLHTGLPEGAIRGGFKEKRPVSSLWWGPFSGVKFPVLKNQYKFQWFQNVKSKTKQKKGPISLFLLMPLLESYLLAWPAYAFFLWGPRLFGGGLANNILRGPCQQLLTLLTLISATGAIHHGLVMDVQSFCPNQWNSCWHAKIHPLTKNIK